MLEGHLLNSFIKSQSEKHIYILSNPPPTSNPYLNIWAENFGGISSSIADIWQRKVEAEEEGGDYLY